MKRYLVAYPACLHGLNYIRMKFLIFTLSIFCGTSSFSLLYLSPYHVIITILVMIDKAFNSLLISLIGLNDWAIL